MTAAITRLFEGRSTAHNLALVWVSTAIASTALAFVAPVPVDILTIGLFVLLPVLGLTDTKPGISGGFAIWLVIAACTVVGSAVMRDAGAAATHVPVSIYLFGTCFLFASFIAKSPRNHTPLFVNAYLAAGGFAAILGTAGIWQHFSGAQALLTHNGRATALFGNPDDLGSFLILPLLAALHYWLTPAMKRALPALAAVAVITTAIVLTFSRSTWIATAVALALYGYLCLITAERNTERMKLAGLVAVGAALLALVLVAALQAEAITRILAARTPTTFSSDAGAIERLSGQARALSLILENPLGLGAGTSVHVHGPANVHNVYLSMFLSAGWLGGLLYFLICGGTLALGFRHALNRSPSQPLFLVAYAALAGLIVAGAVMDTDHWRHFYHLMGVVWGLMASGGMAAELARDTGEDHAGSPLNLRFQARTARIVGASDNGVVIPFNRRRPRPGTNPRHNG